MTRNFGSTSSLDGSVTRELTTAIGRVRSVCLLIPYVTGLTLRQLLLPPIVHIVIVGIPIVCGSFSDRRGISNDTLLRTEPPAWAGGRRVRVWLRCGIRNGDRLTMMELAVLHLVSFDGAFFDGRGERLALLEWIPSCWAFCWAID